ncbi:hypothetical protein C4572_03645 [Candidatus Parcubacteria bacterium]|nr:MAG: hypothetical protein C4572_03645 [Candidatus Parcubacteria bacterium]
MKNIKKVYYTLIILLFLVFPLLKLKAEQCTDEDSGILCNPLSADSFDDLISVVSKLAINIGIPIAALFIIYSGLKLVMARGSEDKIKDAKNGLLWSIIGTAILLGAWVIVEILQSTVDSLE